jgi:DNA-binding GntR family transcriptional regulator
MANPMYRQIAEDLREHDASRNTVRDAVKWLTSLGLVETRPGQGTFVVDDIDPFVRYRYLNTSWAETVRMPQEGSDG